MALQYWKTNGMEVRDSLAFTKTALVSSISYHAGPQMYTSSIVSREVIDSVRKSQGGRLIISHPKDAFLCASKSPSFRKYLY